jgi:long-chain acyl-CoA synthetase
MEGRRLPGRERPCPRVTTDRMALSTLADLISSLATRGEREAIVAFQREKLPASDQSRSGPTDPSINRMPYADLARRIDLVAYGLMGEGLTRGDRVAVLAPNQPTWIVAALASIRAGATLVPIDVQLQDETLAHVLRNAEPRVLFTVKAHEERVRKSRAAPRTLILLDDDNRQKSQARNQKSKDSDQRSEIKSSARTTAPTSDFRPPTPRPDDPAVLFYTSGTTGPPKGVPLTHRNIAHQLNVLMEIKLVRPSDRVLLPLPFHHVYPFVMGILAPLALGVPIVLPQALTGPHLIRAAREGEVTAIIGVPRLYRALLDGIEREAVSAGRLPALLFQAALGLSTFMRRRLGLRIGRHLLAPVRRRIGPKIRIAASGGAALPPEIAYRLEALGWRVASGYGLTETSPLLTLNYPAPGKSQLDTAGKPIPGVELRIDHLLTATDTPSPRR